MQLQELVLCATTPSLSNPGPGSIALHDIQTGATLASFKQTSAGPHCTAVAHTRDGQGGFMLAAQPDKSIMNVYNFQKDQLALKIVLPEKLSCIAVDPRGEFCAAGTSQGRLYIWEIASGIMYNAWDAHYRQVGVLRFTQDSAALLSGSEDSAVNVWSVSRLLDDSTQNELPAPYTTLSDHTLPITDVVVGAGAFPRCRVLTASVDHSVKVWDLESKSLLTTFHFPRPVSTLAWDSTERLFFSASPDGFIHQVNLFRQRDDKLSRTMEAVGGAGSTDVIRITDEDQQAARKRLIAVDQPVMSMTISLTSSLLLVGTASGLVHSYDIASHQLLRTISTHKGLSIAHLQTMLKPPDLVGHVSLSLSAGNPADSRDTIPVRTVAPFQRMRDPKMREAHEVAVMLPPSLTWVLQKPVPAFFDYPVDELLRDHASFVPTSGVQPSGVSLQTRVSELESEVVRLREQLGRAKSINDTMWETVVQRVVAESREKAQEGEEMDRQKRARV
ncbi:uncharacterized protein PHACADRAFT_166518 [Phanerochaete carnosa HHB-10118-sp]|uniref:Pre-rRNA-processing protein IPI3 n=1 Tax=Phanerochaete carnosa (strain HHB-10118-sp) TaxID=650164 RepID=K5VTQ2_PHACS|nr:uncharacterized protein PHACADRAFT_166518 [Phanerochaete carnosa HHB-10118-sp]EKM49939.1 hypothetical protein PHACADRAFT_166518 [Phanerochaete carnosa HHB-10118-sp]